MGVPSHLPSAAPTTAVASAFAHTRRLTRQHYENFPVAGLLIPKRLRQHVCNIYAFARGADDFADEAAFAGERMERLQDWRSRLHQCALVAMGVASEGSPAPSDADASTTLVFRALAESIRQAQLPVSLLNDLLTAFMLDVKKSRYQSFAEVLHYCRHSANPVGRLVLHLFGYGNESWMKLSDHICTALQLANFWQDVALDLQKNDGTGRIYVPQEEMRQYGVTEAQLFAHERSPPLCELMRFQVERTRALFAEGRPLCDLVPHPRLRWQLRLTWLGGMRILERIERNHYDLFQRPTLGWRDILRLLWRAARW